MCTCGYLVEASCLFDCGNSRLNRTTEACKKKFNSLYKLYKEDKLANGILGSDCHACKFHDSFDQLWHQTRTVMKHVIASANDSISVEKSTTDIEKDQNSNDIPISTTTLAIKVDNFFFKSNATAFSYKWPKIVQSW